MTALKPLGFLSFLYENAAGFKNHLYENQILKPLHLPVPVISIGNLTMGGTGKTPITHLCLQHFLRSKVKVAVVSRNYRAEVNGIAKVDTKRPGAAAYYGDEPVLLAEKNPEALFFVGPQKYKTAEWAYTNFQPQVILVDDGFQHRQLHRNLDVVILDATESWAQYQCVPQGRAREPWGSLERAHVILISKANLAQSESLKTLVENVKPFGKPLYFCDFRIHSLQEFFSGQKMLSSETSKTKLMLVSAIARPQTFERSMKAFSAAIVDHIRFADHYSYKPADVNRIVQRWKALGKPTLVTTEKDCVKLKTLWPDSVPLWTAPLEVKINAEEDGFYEILAQVFR